MKNYSIKILSFILIVSGISIWITLKSGLPFLQKKSSSPALQIDSSDFIRQSLISPGIEFDAIYTRLYYKKDKIRRGETFAQILDKYNIPPLTIHKIVNQSSDSDFEPANIQKGRPYRLYYTTDTSRQPYYFIYYSDDTSYYVVQLQDNLAIREGKKKVTTKTKKVAAIINNSLYETLQEKEVSPLIALRLSEIYAWEIDFFRIKKGDRFKVIYNKKYVDKKPIGIGKIHGAFFVHQEDTTYAIPFKQDNKKDYFNTEGESLRKELLKAPLRYTRITSGFTYRRYHPVQGRYKAHLGVDYAAPTGTPVHAVGDGTVIAARYAKYNGNFVKIRHNSVHTTQYLHLQDIADGIHRGAKVKQGQTIGYVGSTGLATGPHLCYRFWKNGQQVNPLTVEVPPSTPVKEEYQEEFRNKKEEIVSQLDRISFSSPPGSSI